MVRFVVGMAIWSYMIENKYKIRLIDSAVIYLYFSNEFRTRITNFTTQIWKQF